MLLTEKYKEQITGIISCYDRVILQSTLSQWGYAEGMTSYSVNNNIKIFDFPSFAQSLRDSLNEIILSIAKENNVQIEYIRRPSTFSKESNIQKTITEKNIQQGIVKIYSALEPCLYYKPYYNKSTGISSLRTKEGICLHYYIYFIDKNYGLCFLRIPTYAPFRLQFYFNGHNLLEHKLKKKDISYSMMDNAFLNIANFEKAQLLSDNFKVEDLHQFLNLLTDKYLPFLKKYNQTFRWSIMQAEYSTDIIFKKPSDFQLFYQDLIYKVALSVKPDNISTFLGKKFSPLYLGETGNSFINSRILGTRIKHRKGDNYIKIYDKFGTILRIETTVNSVTDFQHFRQIDKKDGTKATGIAKMKKNIYSLYALGQVLKGSNSRYLEFISAFEDNTQGNKNLLKLSEPVYSADRSSKGFNFFNQFDLKLLHIISRGEFLINGIRNKDIRIFFKELSPSSISRILKRLLLHNIIKRAHKSYKYYLTTLGKAIIATALKLKEFLIIPKLSAA